MTEIRIIGPRDAGKTTYLAALAAFPHKRQFPGLDVKPVEDPAENLVVMAENILKQGLRIPPTVPGDEPIYRFYIKIPPTRGLPVATTIDLIAKDYAGEIFEDIAKPYRWDKVKSYVRNLLTVQGWMIVLTDWESEHDTRLYKPVFKRLWEEIAAEQEIRPATQNLRIAVVMNKCERGELWPGRLDPGEDLFKVRLPETYRFLTTEVPPRRLKFFACSSFGVLGRRNPRPNRRISKTGDIENAVLRKPSVWHPYGILAPIYWLSTGRILYDQQL